MHHPIAIVAAGVVLVFVQIALALSGYSPMPGAEDALAGPDSYMRLLRVEVWANSEGWRDVGFPLSNAPYGETLHWTRPFDVLLLVGARPLGWLIGFRDGLYWWGAMISPLLQFASLLALSWATRAHLSNRAFVFLALLFVTQPALAAVYSVARPDHHSLLAFLFVIGVALFLRGLAGRLRCCGAAGVIGGLAIWVSIEGAAPVVVALGVLGAAWMVRGEWYLRDVIWYLTGVALALSVAMPLEHGFAALAALEYDRISIVHWGLIVVALTAAGLVERALRRLADPGWLARMIGGAAILAAPLMLVAFVFPDFLGGPFVEVDPALGAIWLDHIDEVQTLNAGDFAIYLGPSVLAGAYLAYKIWRRRQQCYSNSLGLIYLAVLLAVFGSLAAYQVRWSIYPAIVALAPWVLLLRAMFQQKIEWRLSSRIRIPLRTPLFLAVLSAPVAGGAILMSLGLGASAVAGLASQPKDGAACPWAQFAPT
ncbi:MAG: hypothetical protein JKY20_10890, partial [Alphaproteobacteria bacterium]|nr:hypothetical protein [Alphaproteobacteria bacterium]